MRRVSRLVVVVLVLSLVVAGSLVVDPNQRSAAAQVNATEASTAQSFDSTTFLITTHQNGSATFTIRYERRLTNETERDQFETYAQRFENQSTELYSDFQARADALTAAGRNATGRDMQASNFRRSARVEERFNTIGILELSFQWEAFAVVRNDGRVVVGDVFDGGIYLGPKQSLVFAHGDALQFASVDPDGSPSGDTLAASDSVTWQGERDFSDERPRATFEPASAPTTTTTSGGGGNGDGGDGGDGGTTNPGDAGGDGLGMLPMLALALVAVLVAAFAYREYGGDLVTTDDDGSSDGPAGTVQAETPTADTPTESEPAGSEASAGSTEPAVTDEELLTDEDRVVSLLEDHGGRMRQVNIVDETGWSKSKVSMLLSDMEDDDQISKLRVGRENIISLDGHEPDVAGSPFDDEDDDT
ncbi:helix-turn-helix transcriptional regulator [Halorubellus salinus]|uniref:helix-turn-helix transcriptional regulator n=1 Tax=Halorubellus salinus TaxID=755309 RepID=UPI001D09509E|nr:hypothetical protein [Halorubellus salinus]